MSSAVIDNPIINSPFDASARHWRFGENGITPEILLGRRPSAHFVPIAPVKKKHKPTQLSLNIEWTGDRLDENKFINAVRVEVASWRDCGRPGLSSISRETSTRPTR